MHAASGRLFIFPMSTRTDAEEAAASRAADEPAVLGSSRSRRWLGLLVWAGFIGGYFWFARSRDLGPLEAAEELRQTLSGAWWAPIAFVVFYTLRPVVLFPASVLTILGGLVFGPIWGVVWTVLGSSLSTVTTHLIGRFFAPDTLSSRLTSIIGPLLDRARDRPLETALIMRLLYLPFDLVGYLSGFAQLRLVPFLAGSVLGTIPGTVAFVGFGASIESLDEGTPSFDLRILAASAALAIAGSLFSRWLRKRTDTESDQTPTPVVSESPKESL